MVDIFDEVNEELKRDKAHMHLKKYGPSLMVAAICVVIGAAAWQFYQQYKVSEAEKTYVELRSALDLAAEGKVFESESALADLKGKAHGGYALMARFLEAAQLAQRNEAEGAAAFEAIAADASVKGEYADVARVRAAWLHLNDWDYTKMQGYLSSLMVPENYFRHLAREIIVYSAAKAGQWAEARKWLGLSAGDLQTPKSVRERLLRFSETLPKE